MSQRLIKRDQFFPVYLHNHWWLQKRQTFVKTIVDGHRSCLQSKKILEFCSLGGLHKWSAVSPAQMKSPFNVNIDVQCVVLMVLRSKSTFSCNGRLLYIFRLDLKEKNALDFSQPKSSSLGARGIYVQCSNKTFCGNFENRQLEKAYLKNFTY